MLPLYTTVAILLVIGILSILEFDVHAFWQYLMKRGDRQSLKDDIGIMAGEIPKGFFKRQNYETAMILKSTGRENSFQVVRVISMITAVVGIVVAMLFDNIFLIPVFAIVFWLIPRLYIISSASIHKKHLNEELETTMSILTSSYKNTENFIQSVRTNLDLLRPPIKVYFEMFLAETDRIDPNLVSALNRLKTRIPNPVFHGWVNTLIQCQSDRAMIRCLDSFVERFSDMRAVQADLEASLSSAKVTVYIMAGLCVGCIPGFRFLNEEWYYALVNTMPGKASIAVAIALTLFSLWQVHKLSAPVE